MIINANALHIPLADQSVHMIVTSPPYWGLRNYGVSGQLGLERTPEEYIANTVNVFRECWRVLRDDGTLWLNIGDSYSGSGKGPEGNLNKGAEFRHLENITNRLIPNGTKPKDIVGIPWRLAFALQADGWYLRSDIIWRKPNPMPESVTDRPTKSHEYLFLLTKQARYYYDAEAIKESQSELPQTLERQKYDRSQGHKLTENKDNGWKDSDLTYYPHNGRNRRSVWTIDNTLIEFINFAASRGADIQALIDEFVSGQSDIKDIWTIPTAPYKGAHFATFPPALVEPCIKAGTSERGCCPKCGKGWRRVIDKNKPPTLDTRTPGIHTPTGNGKMSGSKTQEWLNEHPTITIGWQPSCICNAGEPVPCLVFDPFVGSGTTVKVAYDLGRRGIGLDLSLEYLDEQARKRIHNGHTARLF